MIATTVAALATVVCLSCLSSTAWAKTAGASSAKARARPRHVFIIILENEAFENAFGRDSPAPYLSRELVSKGELLRQYYAIGHLSLGNYLAIISGQAPNKYTQRDCLIYYDFVPLAQRLDAEGQVSGAGCVYPQFVLTIANQLEAANLTWGGYMEDMRTPCRHPELGRHDSDVVATAESQYATRHNPFVYFHSIIDYPTCAQHDVPLARLDSDLKSTATTPNLVFITPNLCNSGHDSASKLCQGGGLVAADRFLRRVMPGILASPAYLQDGMVIITFDEANRPGKGGGPAEDISSACCEERSGPNTAAPGGTGPGGGRVGALLISRYVRPGTVNDHPYNHYALLRSLEDLYGLGHLGYAAQPGLRAFGDDVYNVAQ